MTSEPKPFGIKIHGFIGETQITSRRKTSASRGTSQNIKKPRISEDDDDQGIYPESLLQVEVNESDDLINPSDIGMVSYNANKNPEPYMDVDKNPDSSTRQKRSTRLKSKPRKIVASADLEFVDVEFNHEDDDHDPDYGNKTKRKDPARSAKIPKKKGRRKGNITEFVCHICNMMFAKKKILSKHLTVHLGDIKCPICGIAFRSKMNMSKHISHAHQKQEKCDKCPAEFHTKEQLEDHISKNKHIKCKEEFEQVEFPEPTDPCWYDGADKVPISKRDEVNYDIQTCIVSKLHKAVPIKDICRLYNVTPEVVNDIWVDRDKFIMPKRLSRRTIKYVNSIIEPPIVEWFNREKVKNVCITGRMIQNLAEKIARDKGFFHFFAGSKWLEGFKKRNEITLGNSRKDRIIPPESMWKSKFFEDRWQKIRPMYSDDDIYMADEVGLFYNPSKSREKKFAGRKFIQGEMIDRLSMLVCTNISGTDKRRLLVCGVEDPLKNSYRCESTLPVEYKRHAKCYFTTHMFEEYCQRWNRELRSKNKKVLLIIDRASIHSKLDLSHLKLEFLPWKAVNTLMAIKGGIYARLRSEFRNMLLKFKLMNVMRGFDRNLTCLEALEMLEKAWDRVPRNVITKSFVDLGYEVQTLGEEVEDTDKDNEKYCEYLKNYDVEPYFGDLSTLDMYLTVEDHVLLGKGTNPTLFGGNHKSKEDPFVAAPESPSELPLNTDRPMSNDKELLVKKTRALADLEIVRKQLLSKDTSYSTYCNFLDVENEVIENFVKFNY